MKNALHMFTINHAINTLIFFRERVHIILIICLYRRIWLITILRKILNLSVVTKGFNYHIYNNTQK
jgi:hypothetical protein